MHSASFIHVTYVYCVTCSVLPVFSFLHMYFHRLSDCRWRGDNACGGRGKRELRNAVRRRTLIAVGVAAHLALGTVWMWRHGLFRTR